MGFESIIDYASESVKFQKKTVFNAGVEASLEYANPKKNYAPKIQLLFSPFGLPYIPLEILGTNVNSIVNSLSWQKDRNNPGGVLALTITPSIQVIKEMVDILNKYTGNLYSTIWGELGVDLEDLFKPMTLCQLWIDGYHVMTGTVRACQRSCAVGNDSKDVSYSIIIDELGNIYNKNIISFHTLQFDGFQKNLIDDVGLILSSTANLKGVSLAKGIEAIINAWIATTLTAFSVDLNYDTFDVSNSGMSLSDGLPLALRLLNQANPLGGIANLSFAQNMIVDTNMFENQSGNGGSSLWGFLQSFIPNPWMEFFTESGGRTIVTDAVGVPSVLFPGFSYTVARSTPYSNPLIGTVNPIHLEQVTPYDLTVLQMLLFGDFIIITDDDITEKNIGFDSSNQSTIFHAQYGSGGTVHAPDTADKPIHSIGPLNPLASGGRPTFGNIDMFQSINCTHLLNLGITESYTERIVKNKLGFPNKMMSKPALSNLLCTWFRNQSRFREGSVSTRYIPYARVGMYCLYLPSISGRKPENLRDIGIYYIDSLSHNYSRGNDSVNFSTELNLIRGVPLPTSLAQTALLLFDYEILPPESGVSDGEARELSRIRQSRR